MFTQLTVLLPPFLLGIGLFFTESVWASNGKRLALFLSITIACLHNILSISFSSPLLNFLLGLGSSWYMVWSADLLFLQTPALFQRVYKETLHGKNRTLSLYKWKPIPEKNSLRRALWVLDLVTNLRELGWQHGLHTKSIPEINVLREESIAASSSKNTWAFLLSQSGHALRAHLYMSLYEQPPFPFWERLISHVPGILQETVHHNIELWTWIFYIYSLLNLFYSLIALVAVGVLGSRILGTAGEPWMYPPIFGPAKTFFYTWEIQAFWGRWWHNVLRRSLLSIPQAIAPAIKAPRTIQKLVGVSIGMFLSGWLHAASAYAVCHQVQPAAKFLAFFCLLPVPIVVQGILSGQAKRAKSTQTVVIRGIILLIGFFWVSWTYPMAFWNRSVLDFAEQYRVPWNVWPELYGYVGGAVGA